MSSSFAFKKETDMERNQMKDILRLVVGGYLVYLAYDLFKSSEGKVQFIAAAVLFALVGVALFIFSLLTLVKSSYFRNSPPPEDEEPPEEE